MKRKTIKITALVLALMLSLSIGASAAAPIVAAPYSNAYIDSYVASISAQGSGAVKIAFTVKGTGVMTSIGAMCINVYTPGNNDPVYTFWQSSYSDMLGSNCKNYSSSVTYYGSSGTRYYAIVTCFAKNSSGSGTEYYTTGTVTA